MFLFCFLFLNILRGWKVLRYFLVLSSSIQYSLYNLTLTTSHDVSRLTIRIYAEISVLCLRNLQTKLTSQNEYNTCISSLDYSNLQFYVESFMRIISKIRSSSWVTLLNPNDHEWWRVRFCLITRKFHLKW